MGTLLFLLFMAFLYNISDEKIRWWIVFFVITILLAKCGVNFSGIKFYLAILFWKIFKDLITGCS